MDKIQTLCKSVIVILMGTAFPALAMVYDSDGSSTNIQFIHDNLALDGDTITIPAGTFFWTTPVTIDSGTAVIPSPNVFPSSDDATTIVDNFYPRPNSGIIRLRPGGALVNGKGIRITGITICGAACGGQVAGGSNGVILR
jgi:hypothetical protein